MEEVFRGFSKVKVEIPVWKVQSTVTIRRICSLCEEDPEDQSETGLEQRRTVIFIFGFYFLKLPMYHKKYLRKITLI